MACVERPKRKFEYWQLKQVWSCNFKVRRVSVKLHFFEWVERSIRQSVETESVSRAEFVSETWSSWIFLLEHNLWKVLLGAGFEQHLIQGLWCLRPVNFRPCSLRGCLLISEIRVPLQRRLNSAVGFNSSGGAGALALQTTKLWHFVLALRLFIYKLIIYKQIFMVT